MLLDVSVLLSLLLLLPIITTFTMKRKAEVDRDDVKKEQKRSTLFEAQDKGHRYGNFHSYYDFHPPSTRLDKMKDILEYIGTNYEKKDGVSFEYCDLGCNEGDLTIEIASALQQQLSDARVHVVGIDMDPILIERAKTKPINNQSVDGDFQVGNVCETLDEMLKDDSVDLTSLFSMTMWIHLHAGDKGLQNVLKKACQKTRQFLLIEPQPSKWYE